MDLPNISNGLSYQKRPPYFAMKYLRMLLKTQLLMEIKADGFALCSLVALTEDAKRYQDAPRFWTDQLLETLGVKSRTTLGEIRNRCVKAGVLHYQPGKKGTSMVLWTLWPKCWDGLDGHFLDDVSVQNLDSIQAATPECCPNSGESDRDSVQKLHSIPSASRTHSSLPPNPTPTPLLAEVVENGLEEKQKQVEQSLIAAGVAKARETIQETLLNGTTLETMSAVIAYYSSRPGCWGPGALRRRLTLGSAQALPPEQGWPPAVRSRENQLRTNATVASDREKRSTDAKAAEDRKAKERQLEFEFGELLDSMPVERLHQIVNEKRPSLLPTLRRYGAKSNLVRFSLLGLLATVAKPSR